MNLAQHQARFYAHLRRKENPAGEEFERWLVASPDLSGAERMEIYVDMYMARLINALREDFPKTFKLLGEERFDALAQDYATEYPSQHPDLGRLGCHFAGFVRARAEQFERPDAADLATLEWAHAEVFVGAPADCVSSHALSDLGAEAFVGARLHTIPALQVIYADYDVAELWRRLANDLSLEAIERTPCALVIWRRGFDIYHKKIAREEASALKCAIVGAPLAEVCGAFEQRKRAAQAAFAALSTWFEEGWIAGISWSV